MTRRSQSSSDGARLAIVRGIIVDCLANLEYEPRILRHGFHYDDPWQRERMAGGDPFKHPKPITVLDAETGIVQTYPSMSSYSRLSGISVQMIRHVVSKGRLLRKRYKITLT